MSDTDDTDLLLLIPPDFFLVNSPDLGSDCSINFAFEHDQVKDSIVSDLITQVNDLESRICMIEHLDRSVTHCSPCIEDSFVNQSVNSLTESDVLRAQIKIKPDTFVLQISNANHMLESFEDSENYSTLLIQRHLSDSKVFDDNLIANNAKQPTVNIDNDCEKHINTIDETGSQDVLVHKADKIKAPSHKEDKKELIHEVDCFLKLKKKQKLSSLNQSDVNGSKEVLVQLNDPNDGVLPLDSDELIFELDNLQLHTEIQDHKQTLALPEVFELLKEIEETQYEIEKKLKCCESDFQSDKTNNDDLALNRTECVRRNKITNSQMLGLEDLSSNHRNLLLNKQTENIHERLKSMKQSKYHSPDNYRPGNCPNAQVSYLFKPNMDEESSHKKDSKSQYLSPNRTSLGFNPVDVVMANLPIKNGRGNISQFEINKELPEKVSSFKRHLNFEHSDLPYNQTKPRQLYQTDEIKNNSLDNPNKIGKSSVHFPSSSTSRQSFNHDGKYNYISTQRAAINKGNHNEHEPSSTVTLQPKMSSTNLLSLSELWNKEPTFYSDDPNKLRQKLEEEKYRRQHCEQQIQALQVRVLEEQERLAVAVKVDQEKDKAILQITESWRKLNNHWSELEEQRHSLAQQLQQEKESSKAKTDELMKKVERWEKEVSQALDLAAGYKEKSEAVQKQMDLLKKDTEEKLDEANSQLVSLNKENKKIVEENQHLLNQLDGFRGRIEEEEMLLSKLKAELEKCKKRCSEYEAEVNVLKEQKESLANKIRDEKGRNSVLEQQKNALQQAFNETSKREKAAQDEARVSNERIEVARTELRALYQGQLETVVKEKLQEFQCQLEAAEAALKAELHSKEKQWAEKANDQCRQLQEKQKMELYQKEESLRSEITKWKVRLMESEKMKSISESKLQEETSRRADIAHRLHSVMETQWREALNIISNPLQNAYEVTKEESRSKWSSNPQSSERLKGSGDVKASQSNSSTSLCQAEEVPFYKEGLVTTRTAQPQQEHQLKKYIQMLLERGPGNPVLQNDSLQESLDPTFSQESSVDYRYMLDNAKNPDGQERFGHSSKPPWK